MNISIDHLSRLARLSLNDAEKPLYGSQIEKILQYMEKLNSLDTTGVDPTSHVIDIRNVTRGDIPGVSLQRSEALRNAPDATDAFYRVPRIIE